MTPEQRMIALADAATQGEWTASRLIHADRGDSLTPAEVGEYVMNSVIKSADKSGTMDFLAVLVTKTDGPADVCHVGNGPTSPANAALIAHMHPDRVRALAAVIAAARAFVVKARRDVLSAHDEYTALTAALAAFDALEGGKCAGCDGTGVVNYPNDPETKYPCQACNPAPKEVEAK